MRSLVAFLVFVSSSRLAVAQTPPAAPPPAASWNAQSIAWPAPDSDGTRFVFLEGRNDRPGQAFSYAYFLPAGHWEHHWHSGEVRFFVVSGALRVSYGERLDSLSARVYPAGTFLYAPAGKPHTMGANVDTVIIGVATGPWRTHYKESPTQPVHRH